jgi:hypothetical protein
MRGKWIKDNKGEWVYHQFWNGYSAKHYWLEQTSNKEFYDTQYATPKEAEKYLKKILRHFKIEARYQFTNNSNGHAELHWWGGNIRLPKMNISLGLICHEIAHILAYKKWGKGMNHNRKFQTQVKRVFRWAKRYLPQNQIILQAACKPPQQ